MEGDRLGRLAARAAAQHGSFSVAQAAELGVDRRRLNREAAAGTLERIHPSVYRFAAVGSTEMQRVWAAALEVGRVAAVSHESALHVLRVERVPFAVVVSVPAGHRADHGGIRVHRVGDLRSAHVMQADGLLVTTLERTVVDLVSVFTPRRMEWLVDHLTITERRTTVGAVGRVLRQVNRRGRRRIRVLDALLDARRPGQPAPRSRVERRVDQLLESTGLPPARAEYPLPGGTPGEGFVDRAWPEVRLILEVDGRTWHARERSMAKDRARDRSAARQGWLTMRVLDDEVRDIPQEVVDDVVATFRSRSTSPKL